MKKTTLLSVSLAVAAGLCWASTTIPAQTAETPARIAADENMLPYPYEWSDETCQNDFIAESFWGMGWMYDATTHSFVMSGKSTNWMGDLGVKTINFPVDEGVTCSFEYALSANSASKLSFKATYTDGTTENLGEVELQPSGDFTSSFFSFTAKGPASLNITASYLGDWFDYGSIYLRNICFRPAVLDVAASKILSPATDKMAIGQDVTVTARFTNVSPFDAQNPVFCYNADGNEVKETYEGTLAAGQSVDYTFEGTFRPTEATTGPLGVWVEMEGDGNEANDMVETMVTFYEPLAFPYHNGLDGDNSLFATIDANGDGASWLFGSLTDGNAVAASPDGYSSHNDYLVLPAIQMPKGRHRVSFYYAALNAGNVTLELLCGTQPSAEGLSEQLFEKQVTNTGWLNGYKLINVPEDGVYYFAFRTTGQGSQIVIDNIKIDDEEDLCINQTTFDTESGYDKTTSKVTLSYVNHGLTPQKDITVKYFCYPVTNNGQGNVYGEPAEVEETVAEEVQPGDTLYYTFEQEADISTPGQGYQLVGQVITAIGEDTQNDMALGQYIEHYGAQELPYDYAFNDDSRNQQWSFTREDESGSSAWNIEDFYFCYDGEKDLKHTNYQGNPSNDWAYSEAIHMPAGEYELSFFHRGRTYFSGEEYNQSYEVMLGNERTPEAMTQQMAKYDDIDISRPAYQKHVNRFTISEEGNYYLGFHNYSMPNNGETHIDGISIKAVEPGIELPYECTSLAADSAQWTCYNAAARNFTQWRIDGDALSVNRTEDDAWNYFEGMLVSPKLHLTPALGSVTIEVEYELTSDADTLAVNLYGGEVNNPDEMTLLASDSRGTKTLTFTLPAVEADQDFYLGLRTNTNPEDQDNYYYGPFYTLKIKSVKVTGEFSRVLQLADNSQVSVKAANGSLYVEADENLQRVELYDAAGTLCGAWHTAGQQATLPTQGLSGVVMVKIFTAQGVKVRKIAL